LRPKAAYTWRPEFVMFQKVYVAKMPLLCLFGPSSGPDV
jgi:hypothetical protein